MKVPKWIEDLQVLKESFRLQANLEILPRKIVVSNESKRVIEIVELNKPRALSTKPILPKKILQQEPNLPSLRIVGNSSENKRKLSTLPAKTKKLKLN